MRLTFILLILLPGLVRAQQTGEVDYPYLGIKFTIPDAWMGQEYGEGYMMGSNTEPGFILMLTHQANTIEQLTAEAKAGIMEADGTQLTLQNELENFEGQAVGGVFGGVLQGTQTVQGYIAASLNPYGQGVTVMAITDPPNYSERYRDLALEIIRSLKFAQPKESPATKEWKETLKGAKLTYMSSYTSSGYDSFGGYSAKTEILLCSNGQFSFYSSSSVAVDTGGAFGNSSGQNQGQGTWNVASDGTGTPLLNLNYTNGQVSSYKITYSDGKTYLDGERYFRTYDHGECY